MRPTEAGGYSLRRRLVLVVLGAVIGVWVVLGITLYGAVLRVSAVEFDEQLQQLGRILLAYADHEYAETHAVVGSVDHPTSTGGHAEVVYQIWSAEGELVYRSAGAPTEPIGPRFGRGFYDVRLASGDWRAYSIASQANTLVVQVAEPAAHRAQIASRVLAAVGLPVLLALPLLAFLVYLVTSFALGPLSRMAGELRERNPQDLRPLAARRLPGELQVLGDAINELLARQGAMLERESRFTGDAAHELRTPLAAVRAQAQLAKKLTRNDGPPELNKALDRLIAGADRASRLVSQLLALARLERPEGSSEPAGMELTGIVQMVVHDLETVASKRDVRVLAGTLPAVGLPEELVYLILRNLVENAIQHSPPRAVVHIDASLDADLVRLSVSDQGPGVPAELREQVVQRFHRASSAYDGSGLGLSIVARAAQILGGSLQLGNAPGAGGLSATVEMRIGVGGMKPGPA
ncbi:MAG: ATP-binding protein [Steroidobacteraceae bacterium]